MWWWDMKIHANMATWLSKSTWVREVWNLVHCQSNKITMPEFWGEISLWILNKHLRTHHSKIEMKVYWLNCHKKKKHYGFLKVCRKKIKYVLIKVFFINILHKYSSSFKIGIGLYFKPLTIITTVLSPQPSPSLSQLSGCLEYS